MRPGKNVLPLTEAARRLGVAADCSPEALQAAYRAAVKAAHPDRPGGDEARLREVIEAYARLKGAQAEAVASARPAPSPILEITPQAAVVGGRLPTHAPDGRPIFVNLPAGLRAGDRVRVAGEVRAVTISVEDGLSVIGDHLCLSVDVAPHVLRQGGSLTVDTPMGPRTLRVTRQDGVRGLVRVAGKGLPPRAGKPRGDLLLHLHPAAAAAAPTSDAEDKRRRFAEDWAA